MDIKQIVQIAQEAGHRIMEVYEGGSCDVEYKTDASPLTVADRMSHELISGRLKRFCPDIPILSEEQMEIPYSERRRWDKLWLVDPLDGTKEFIKRNGEFTVNIALIDKGIPYLGVIHVPVKDVTYYAVKGQGSYRMHEGKEKRLCLLNKTENNKFVIAASRSHPSEKLDEFVREAHSMYDEVEFLTVGSSLKFCLVAENQADVYPRFGPTMEWDTAAGQAIVEGVGGSVRNMATGEAINYNKAELINDPFLADKRSTDIC